MHDKGLGPHMLSGSICSGGDALCVPRLLMARDYILTSWLKMWSSYRLWHTCICLLWKTCVSWLWLTICWLWTQSWCWQYTSTCMASFGSSPSRAIYVCDLALIRGVAHALLPIIRGVGGTRGGHIVSSLSKLMYYKKKKQLCGYCRYFGSR